MGTRKFCENCGNAKEPGWLYCYFCGAEFSSQIRASGDGPNGVLPGVFTVKGSSNVVKADPGQLQGPQGNATKRKRGLKGTIVATVVVLVAVALAFLLDSFFASSTSNSAADGTRTPSGSETLPSALDFGSATGAPSTSPIDPTLLGDIGSASPVCPNGTSEPSCYGREGFSPLGPYKWTATQENILLCASTYDPPCTWKDAVIFPSENTFGNSALEMVNHLIDTGICSDFNPPELNETSANTSSSAACLLDGDGNLLAIYTGDRQIATRVATSAWGASIGLCGDGWAILTSLDSNKSSEVLELVQKTFGGEIWKWNLN